MPHIRGVRDYSFYNDEDVEHNMSVDEVQTMRLSRVPAYNPAATLAPIIEALRKLAKGVALVEDGRKSEEGCADDEPQKSVTDDSVRADGEKDSKDRSAVEPQQFVAEDTALADDKRGPGVGCADDEPQQFVAEDTALADDKRGPGVGCADDEPQQFVAEDTALADDKRGSGVGCADDEPQQFVAEDTALADDKRGSGVGCADDEPQQFVAEDTALADDKRGSGGGCADDEPQQFVAEGGLQLSDLIVAVEGVGELQLPLEDIVIDKLIGVSGETSSVSPGEIVCTKALEDSHVIPVTELRVELKEEALSRIVRIIIDSLNMNGKCSLKPKIRCLSIYGPGQFCGPRKGSQGEVGSPVRLDVVLPCHCVGGDLHIKHGAQTRKCSADSDTVRWTACYSDCARWLFEVREGHRVLLTYDVDLEYFATSPGPSVVTDDVDVSLNHAVAQHFSSKDRLLVILLHRYSEDSLDWHKIKGRDATYARALLSVAKRQDLRTFLASGRCLETWESSGYHGPVRNGGSVELYCWLDESGRRQKERVSINYEGMAEEVCTFRQELWALGEPDREVKLGWYGEGPAIREQWYHRACVVLVKNK